MDEIEQLLKIKPWIHPTNQEKRYYINVDFVAKFGGLNIERYKTGNVAISYLDGLKISNSEAKRILSDIDNIYFKDDKKIYVKWRNPSNKYNERFWNKAIEMIEVKLKEVN